MLGFAAAFHTLVSLHGVPNALRGLTAAVVGLILAGLRGVARGTAKRKRE